MGINLSIHNILTCLFKKLLKFNWMSYPLNRKLHRKNWQDLKGWNVDL